MIKVLLMFTLLLSACNFDLGNSSSQDQDNDIITIDNSDNSTGGVGDNPLCKGVQSIDGPGGFLWKPESDSTGTLVVLFPEEFTNQFLAVEAELLDGTIEEGVFDGFTNGDRQTWRFSKPGSEYSGRLLIDAGNQDCEYRVPDPSVRQD